MSNNNRGNNNRRRGRGGNRNQGSNPTNRIDSRARGNAPQLLEKFKKLAHDASLNDDRVQAEYYLQFADHYFRVIADAKAQKDEARLKRDEGREQSRDDGDSEDGEGDDNRQQPRDRDREENRQQPRDRGRQRNRSDDDSGQGERGAEGDDSGEDDNPFTREKRPPARPRRKPARPAAASESDDAPASGLDASVLPPSIARSDAEDAGAEEKPKPRRRAPRKRKVDGEDEALEPVS